MTDRISPRDTSLMLTTGSVALGIVSIQLGRRVDYLQHLGTFNSIAAAMLGLVALGLIVAIAALVRARGRGIGLWVAVALATTVASSYLLDE